MSNPSAVSRSGKGRALGVAALTLGLFLASLYVLQDSLGKLNVRDVLAHLRLLPASQLAAAAALTALSYLALGGYDRLALAIAGRPLPWPRVALISFIASALAHNLGLASVSGGSVRLRAYAAEGLPAADIALVQGLVSLTFLLGAGALLSASLVFEAGEAGSLLHLAPGWARAAGCALLLPLGAYVLLGLRRQPLRIRGWQLPLPRPAQALGQFGISMLDLACAAGALYVLLPADLQISYPAFLGLYVVAITLGALSNVPGGLGVFESALLLMLPAAPPAALLGAVLVYRIVYYLAPFALALLLLVGREFAQWRGRLLRITGALRRGMESVLPQALAMAVFAAGAVLLASGSLPAVGSRIDWLADLLPLPVLEASHLAGSALGVSLLILARGLHRRLRAAWWLTLLLLGVGIAASLLKGVDYEEAALLAATMLLLGASRERFYRRAPLTEARLTPLWTLNVAIVIAAAIWLGFVAYRHVDYAHELWWRFAADANAPRMLRASLLAVLVASAYALWSLLGAARPPALVPDAAQLERARGCIARDGDSMANLALLGDKQLLFCAQGDAFIMYQRSGRSWIALGDPVGNPARHPELAWQFRELCDEHGGWCAFYQVRPEQLPLYLDLGLSLSKLGEEARVPLGSFSLDGPGRAELRTAQRKGQREGLRFAVLEPAEAALQLDTLQAISDAWLSHKSTAEKGYSVGRFDRRYLAHFPCAVALRGERIVAFANLWRSGDAAELSVDLMRYGADAPKGVMDYLFIELMLWGKAQGFAWFNLGMAPLSGLEEHPLAPAWHRLGLLVHRYGESFYNFEGLRRYKEKFQPVWRPRYLASPGGLALPRVMLDTATLIAGGVKGMVGK